MYGISVIAYLFLGGSAAGGFFVMALWSLIVSYQSPIDCEGNCSSNATDRISRTLTAVQCRVYALCLLLLLLSVLLLLWELGVPSKVLYIFAFPRFTMITFGTLCLTAEMILGSLLVAASLFRLRRLQTLSRRILPAICLITSLATMGYTGAFLMSSIGIPLWGTWTIVALFIASSLSCGISLVLLASYLIKAQEILKHESRLLGIGHVASLILELVFLALFVYAAFENPLAYKSCELLLSPSMLSIALGGVVGIGIVIPLVCELYTLSQKSKFALPIAEVMCLCGGFLLRFCIIMCGAYG